MKIGDRIAPYSDKTKIGTITHREEPPRTTGKFHPYPILTAGFPDGTTALFYDNESLRQHRVKERVAS